MSFYLFIYFLFVVDAVADAVLVCSFYFRLYSIICTNNESHFSVRHGNDRRANHERRKVGSDDDSGKGIRYTCKI